MQGACSAQGDCLPSNGLVWIAGKSCPQPLASLQAGDAVLSFDRLSGSIKYVKAAHVKLLTDCTEWVTVHLEDGTVLDLTCDHPVTPHVQGHSPAAEPVAAGELRPGPGGDRLSVLKIMAIPVSRLEKRPETRPRMAVTLLQPDRHALFVATPGHNGIHPDLGGVVVDSAGADNHGRVRLGCRRTFVHVSDDDDDNLENEEVRRERASSAPPCVAEYFTVGVTEVDPERSGPQRIRRGRSSEEPSSSTSGTMSSRISSSSGGAPRVVLTSGRFAFARTRDAPGHHIPFEPNDLVPNDPELPASLQTILRTQEAGWPSMGSAAHGQGICKPCAFENSRQFLASGKPCYKGVLCDHCHAHHPEDQRLVKRQARKMNRKKGYPSESTEA